MRSWVIWVSLVYLHSILYTHTHTLVIRLKTVVVPMETKTVFS